MPVNSRSIGLTLRIASGAWNSESNTNPAGAGIQRGGARQMSFLNRVGFETATTGQGTVTVGSAVTQYATPAEAGALDATVYDYVIEDSNDFEIGRGTYTVSGTTFSRDTVLFSKISGTPGTTKLTLSGSAKVYLTATAESLRRQTGLILVL